LVYTGVERRETINAACTMRPKKSPVGMIADGAESNREEVLNKRISQIGL
jgi:hypothetical protein